jgi:cold shock CspA family protein
VPADPAVQGQVTEFDEQRGWGTIESDGRSLPFHCTQITDGTRTIAVGTPVTFEVRAGHMGRWEAAQVTTLR